MLQTVVLAAVAALISAAVVFFLMTWRDRTRIRHVEWRLEDVEERLTRRDKQLAGAASKQGKQLTLSAFDEALVRQQLERPAPVRAPWWSAIVKEKGDGS